MKVWKDDEGRVVIGVFKIDNEKVIIGSVYAPNIDASVRSQQRYSRFILDLEALLGEAKRHAQSFILCGDFNLYCDPYLDTEESNIMPHPYPICKDNFLDFLTNTNAADLLRTTHRRKRLSSFSPSGENRRGIARRLDYLLCSPDLIHDLNKNALFWGPLSDHKYLIAENSEKTTAKTGPGIWRHNDSHLNNN